MLADVGIDMSIRQLENVEFFPGLPESDAFTFKWLFNGEVAAIQFFMKFPSVEYTARAAVAAGDHRLGGMRGRWRSTSGRIAPFRWYLLRNCPISRFLVRQMSMSTISASTA